MSDFTSHDFKVGDFIKLDLTKVKIIKIDHPYATVELPTIDKRTTKVNLIGMLESNIINDKYFEYEVEEELTLD